MDQVLARKLGAATTQSRSHRRLAKFVDWIKAEPGTREAIYKQAADIRRLISNRAAADGLAVIATPEAGSFAKHNSDAVLGTSLAPPRFLGSSIHDKTIPSRKK